MTEATDSAPTSWCHLRQDKKGFLRVTAKLNNTTLPRQCNCLAFILTSYGTCFHSAKQQETLLKDFECFRYRVRQVQVTVVAADREDKFIPIIQEVIELWASNQGGWWFDPIEVASCGQDELLASIIWTVGHLAAAIAYWWRESCGAHEAHSYLMQTNVHKGVPNL